MANELTEELRVLVSAEVDKAVKNLKQVDTKTSETEKLFKKLGSTIASTFTVKAIVGFASESVQAYQKAQSTLNVLNQTIQSTGASAWTSSKELQQMATDLQAITNYGDDEIQTMQSVLLGFKNIKGDNFREATTAILDMATVMGMDLKSAAQSIGKALDDPIKGMDSLKKQGFNFTDAQKEVIQAMLDTGDVAGAQKIVLDELAGTFGGTAEAAVNTATQIKNSWGDLKEGVGKFLTGFSELPVGKGIVKSLNFLSEVSGTFWDNISFLKMHFKASESAFSEWFLNFNDADTETRIEVLSYHVRDLMGLMDKLEEAATSEDFNRTEILIDEVSSYLELSAKERKLAHEDASILKEKLNFYTSYYKSAVEDEKNFLKISNKITQQNAENAEKTNEINNLMSEIATNYKKLSNDDPVIQLQNYQKQLEEIAKNKKTLSTDTTGKDVSESLKQLDYNEDAIKKKIKELRDKMQGEGIKSWKKYFEEITGVSESSFKNGKQAAEKYIGELENTFSNSKAVQEALGKTFDVKDVIEDQMSEIEKTITELLNIPADKIDSVYSLADNNIKGLIDRYKELNKQKKEFEVTDMLNDLNQQVNTLGKSEKYLYLETMAAAGATQTQLEDAAELLDKLSQASNKIEDSTVSWESFLEDNLLSGIEKLDIFKETADETKESIAGLGASLTNLSLKGALTGIESLGKALGEGKSAGDSMKDALVAMSEEILNQLPTLFLQAGLQLIAQGQWPLGLGLMAAGLSTSFVSSFNQGKKEQFEANAFGGVYGSSEYKAFAKGGTFTNQIVSRPTLFRFASGSGFGTGLMGEAGPEAVMPLSRSADGRLGVDASGSGSYVQVLLEVNNYSAEKVQTRESTDDSGQKKIQIMIGSAINSHLSSGKADKALSARYGLKVQGV